MDGKVWKKWQVYQSWRGSQFILSSSFEVCRMSFRKSPAAICCQQQQSRCACVPERGRTTCFLFLIPDVSCLNKSQHLLKLRDYLFTASIFARKMFSGVRFRSCCQSIIGANYLISFHSSWIWNGLRAALCHIHTFCVLYWLKSRVMCGSCLQGRSNGEVAWVRGSEMVCPASKLF